VIAVPSRHGESSGRQGCPVRRTRRPVPDVERKGAGFPYTSVNGNMFSMLNESGRLALRLPEAERAAFLARYDTTLNVAHGVVQKEYVVVPDTLLASTDELREHFAVSATYARSLKPKATTRKKPAG